MNGPGGARMSVRGKFAAWVVTGPVGRLAAFFADVGVYWWRRARGREADPRDR